jgi:hypothetical protein
MDKSDQTLSETMDKNCQENLTSVVVKLTQVIHDLTEENKRLRSEINCFKNYLANDGYFRVLINLRDLGLQENQETTDTSVNKD